MLKTLMRGFEDNPFDVLTWHAIADYLEETGETQRAELVRILRTDIHPANRHTRIQELVRTGNPPTIPVMTNIIGMRFVPIVTQPIAFMMGSDKSVDAESRYDEGPRHKVQLTRPYWLGMTPVTQSQYHRIMGINPSCFCADGSSKNKVQGIDTSDFPVECVSWEDAQEFCRILNALEETEKLGIKYRLPSEAEWEYACRGLLDTYQPFSTGDTLTHDMANFDGRFPYPELAEDGVYLGRTCKVGSYKANAFGLYDMHGNVQEWCLDWYDANYYKTSPKIDPVCNTEGSNRVVRGGGWFDYAQECRASYRYGFGRVNRYYILGFRVAIGSR